MSLQPVAPVADAPGGVRVLVASEDGGRVRLDVLNWSDRPIVVDGTRVIVTTPRGAHARAGSATQTVPPGGEGRLDVHVDVRSLRPGDRVALRLDGAVSANGEELPVPPLEFVAD